VKIPPLGPRGEGWVVLQFACLALVAFGGFLAPGFAPGGDHGEVRLIGDVLLIGGLVIVGWAVAALQPARAFTALPHPRADGSLVESGPYRFVRHPVYSGLILAALGSTISRESLAAGLATIALAVTLDLKRRHEELWLVDRYPNYVPYRTRTKALLPLLY
jgi:protein-S-isoprenylcysteine O-methyltransferase Ste14